MSPDFDVNSANRHKRFTESHIETLHQMFYKRDKSTTSSFDESENDGIARTVSETVRLFNANIRSSK